MRLLPSHEIYGPFPPKSALKLKDPADITLRQLGVPCSYPETRSITPLWPSGGDAAGNEAAEQLDRDSNAAETCSGPAVEAGIQGARHAHSTRELDLGVRERAEYVAEDAALEGTDVRTDRSRAHHTAPKGPRMDQLQPQPFSIHVLPREGPMARVRVTGALDLCTAPELERTLTQALQPGCELRLDLSAVWFMDSTGVRAIATAAHAAHSSGGMLTLDSPLADQPQRIIEMTGLHRLLQLR